MISPVTTWRRQKTLKSFTGKAGTILTWTRIMVPGPQFKKYAPYYVILAEMEDNTHMCGMLVDIGEREVKIGMKVVSVLRKVREVEAEDIIPYGIKFKLYEEKD